MDILHLTPKEDSPPYQLQVDVLEASGINCTTISVPGNPGNDSTRSIFDYLYLYPNVLRHSIDQYDIVHANFGLTAPIALAQPKRPVVLSLWGTDIDGKFGWVSKRCAAYCDATIVMSERMRQELGTDCRVIPHGVDLEQFRPMPQATAIDQLGWDPAVFHVLFPYSPNRKVKNYPRALRIVNQARECLSKPVRLQTVSGVSHSEMSTYMNAADCLLFTSNREGSPNVIKEAMACNLPVVSTDVGDVSERLDGVEPSTVCHSDVELRSALVSILDRGVRSNGRDYATNFSTQWMAERLQSVYNDVIHESSV